MKKFISLILSIAILSTIVIVPNVVSASDFEVSGCYGWNEYAFATYSGQLKEASYKKSSETNYTSVDTQLIQNDKGRVDIPGLAKNTSYNIKLTSTDGKEVIYTITTKSNDRSGYAFFNHSGVGAYNEDGTLRENADVLYVTNENKNTIKYGKYTGIGNILTHASSITNPLAVRLIGTIDTQTRDADGSKTTDKNNGVVSIDGLRDVVKTDDSYFNMLDISGSTKGLTIEGIGDDAHIYKWGMMFKSGCKDIEVRNLKFSCYPEDACSTDKAQYFWLHNCEFQRGENKYDLTDEQDKHYGDGSSDMNGSSNITISYCKYENCKKTSLNGGGDKVKSYNYTYHHNYFLNCGSRLPLTRQVNLHKYNNYYYGCGTCIDARASALVLSENSYFENSSNCYKTTANSTYGNPAIKSVGDFLDNSTFTQTEYMSINSDRQAPFNLIDNKNANPNFDTNSSVFYYKDGKSDVEEMDDALQAKEICKTYSGHLTTDKAISGNAGETPVETTTNGDSTTETTSEISTQATTESTTAIQIGDANADGTIDSIDVSVVFQYVLNQIKMPIEDTISNFMEYIDIDKDGKITSTDVAHILQKALDSSYDLNKIA